MKTGRPLLLGGLDKMIEMIQRSTRAHQGVVNSRCAINQVVIAVADTLVKKVPGTTTWPYATWNSYLG